MSTPVYYALGVLVMAVVTYIPRVLPPVADAPPGGEPVLAVLSVLHALRRAGRHDLPCDFGGDGHPWSAAVGMAVALILAYLRLNLLPVALASTASVFVVEWAMGLYR